MVAVSSSLFCGSPNLAVRAYRNKGVSYYLVLLFFGFVLWLGSFLPTPTVSAQPAPPRYVDPSFFGMHLSTLSDPNRASLNVPFGTLRLWGAFGTGWYNISPSPPSPQGLCSTQRPNPISYDWSTLDAFLDWAQTYNYDVIYTLGAPPCWVSPNNCQTVAPGLCWASNVDYESDWINFVGALAAHSAARPAGRIKYYELWNEPTVVPLFWTGSTSQLAKMGQDAFRTITHADSQALVLTPSPQGNAAGISKFIGDYIAAAQGLSGSTDIYADGIAFHSYETTQAEDVIPVINQLQSTVSGLSLPIFDTEGSWGEGTLTDQDEQAAFVGRTYALQASLGIDRFVWYGWDFCVGAGDCWGPLWMRPGVPISGICPPDCGPVQLKGGMAYATIAQWLTGAQIGSCSNPVQGVWSCPVSRSNGYQAQILWSVNTDPLLYTVSAPYTQSRDLVANCASPIQNQQVTLGHKPLLVETPYPGSSGSAACWWKAVQSISP